GQTLEESKKMILDKMGNYALTVKGRNNGSMTINGEDVDFYFSLTSEFDQIFSKQHKKFSLFSNSYDFSAKYDISYDQSKLKKILKQSDFIKGTSAYPIEKPKSATVKFSEETGKFECIKENPGNKLIFNKFLSAVEETIENGNVNLDLTDTEKYPDMYRNPKVSSDSPELKKKQNTYNYNALRYVVWNMGKGVTEQITPVELTEWSTYENGTLTFDEEKISDWVENFCKKYKTTDKTRLVKMHDNKIVTVQPGDYGWQIDYESALRQAKSVINKKIKRSVINAYLKEPSEENKKAVTFRKKVPYSNTAFQMDTGEDVNYEDVAYDYDTENFTEVSLKEQMVYVIRDGKVAFSCRCISGRPTPERSTKPGAYFIKEHQLNRILRGDNYVTPVTNWVRITWSGTGFHSAKWQRWGSWTPTYYQTRGSHGCVNLSIEDSKTIYDMVKYREAVFIY
ncbi:MAG: L,D-transpeptidase family protein, partial [Lachnospiraceae bacterium]|nr:L,D-transpeptidase family protein [Lachnospiraceae bacterium]